MPDILHDVPLASWTTLGLGGPARRWVRAQEPVEVIEAIQWARSQGLPLLVLGGGSNVVVGDDGFEGLVLHIATRGVDWEIASGRVRVAAGEPWDDLVAASVARGLAGLECLSGIPGSVGATPIQNVGAYGQEVAEVIETVEVWDRRAQTQRVLTVDACGLGYRDSMFKRDPEGFVVLAVTLGLRPGGAPALRYAELARACEGEQAPTLAQVRAQVLALRRGKSMVIEADDPNRRSVGSFFTNPVLPTARADALVQQAVAAGVVASADAVPRFAAGPGHTKIPAAWLIEAAGFHKGMRRGAVGISSRHALALVHHGGGTTRELLALAEEIREGVRARFGVELRPEPVIVAAAG